MSVVILSTTDFWIGHFLIWRAKKRILSLEIAENSKDRVACTGQMVSRLISQIICELDNTSQKFDRLHSETPHFPYTISIIFIDCPYVIFESWKTEENTQFYVVFKHNKSAFILKLSINHKILLVFVLLFQPFPTVVL